MEENQIENESRNFGNDAELGPPLLRPCKSNATRGRRREKAARFRYGNRNVTSARKTDRQLLRWREGGITSTTPDVRVHLDVT